MGSIRHRPRTPPLATKPVAHAGNLTDLFLTRLQSERVHFVTLSAALARAEECPGRIFDDLNFRAHRLKGAAATFGFSELADAAGALERACFSAASSHAAHSDNSVWEPLVGIVRILGTFEEASQSTASPVAAPTEN